MILQQIPIYCILFSLVSVITIYHNVITEIQQKWSILCHHNVVI